MTLPSLHRLLLVLEEVRGSNIISEIVHERSCGFRLVVSHICFEALTVVVVAVWRRHRCHLAAHHVKVYRLCHVMATKTTHHRRMISWRVRLRELVLIIELLHDRRVLYTLSLLSYGYRCAVTLFDRAVLRTIL